MMEPLLSLLDKIKQKYAIGVEISLLGLLVESADIFSSSRDRYVESWMMVGEEGSWNLES
jgi:hypothetical protein